MAANITVTQEEKLVVEALGTRTQIGETVFIQEDGYDFPVAEMEKKAALALVRGEKLTENYLKNPKDSFAKHGKLVNFRLAVPKSTKPANKKSV